MYAIPWIITFFSTKMDKPELVLSLWNKVAQQPQLVGSAYMIFFAVALLVEHEASIIEQDPASLPVVLSSLRVKEQGDLDRLFMRVTKLLDDTPYSFTQLPELRMLMTKTSEDNLTKIWKALERLHTIPMLPAEMFFYCFPDECGCANPRCANSLTFKNSSRGNYLSPESTSICPDLSHLDDGSPVFKLSDLG